MFNYDHKSAVGELLHGSIKKKKDVALLNLSINQNNFFNSEFIENRGTWRTFYTCFFKNRFLT